MQKKIIALAVAGLSTAAFAQTNVTIYGVADVSGQGTNMTAGVARNNSTTSGKATSGGAFNLKNNSSLIGFKGTEDLGNGNKALFQVETNVNVTGGGNGPVAQTGNSAFGSLRDTYVGVSSKYGTGLAGYLSTPFRSTLTSFDVMPGATGDGRIESMMGQVRVGAQSLGYNAASTGYVLANSSVRATAIAYVMPTLYGFNGSLAYTGSANNGGSNQTSIALAETGSTGATMNTQTVAAPQGAISLNLGWTGYGVNIAGAFQQAKVNNSVAITTNTATSLTDVNQTAAAATLNAQGLTSYLVGASYTGLPGLKASVVYNRNTLSTNNPNGNSVLDGAAKGSNNALYAGVSYRFGNNEPRLSYQNVSNTNGMGSNYLGQDGARQWTANWGYYLSKRTQVYGIISGIKNNANAVYNMASGGSALQPTGGQGIISYGAGLRTNF